MIFKNVANGFSASMQRPGLWVCHGCAPQLAGVAAHSKVVSTLHGSAGLPAGFEAVKRVFEKHRKQVARRYFQLRAGKKVISGIRLRERAVSLAGRGFDQLPEKVI